MTEKMVMLDFLAREIEKARLSLSAREQAATVWRSGPEKEWAEVAQAIGQGKAPTRQAREELAVVAARIAARNREDVQTLEAIFDLVKGMPA